MNRLERLKEWWQELTGTTSAPATSRVLLASDVPGIPFRAKFDFVSLSRGRWHEPETDRDVARHLRDVADERTQTFSVAHREEAEHDVQEHVALTPWGSETFSVHVELYVDEQAKQAAFRHMELRHAAVLVDERSRGQARELARLRDHVLLDPALARIWWLKDDPERLKDMVNQGDLFERAAQELAPAPETPSEAVRLVRMLEHFWAQLSFDEHNYLMQRVNDVFCSFDQHQLAQELRATVPSAFPPGQGEPDAVELRS